MTGASFSTSYVVNIPADVAGNNTAFVGFTGSDGASISVQTVNDFILGVSGPIPSIKAQGLENIVPSAPILSAVVSGNQLSISWPASALTYTLESTTNMSGLGSWNAVPQSPGVVGSNFTVTMPIGATNTYFRLFRQIK
jgi:hypothetical protein